MHLRHEQRFIWIPISACWSTPTETYLCVFWCVTVNYVTIDGFSAGADTLDEMSLLLTASHEWTVLIYQSKWSHLAERCVASWYHKPRASQILILLGLSCACVHRVVIPAFCLVRHQGSCVVQSNVGCGESTQPLPPTGRENERVKKPGTSIGFLPGYIKNDLCFLLTVDWSR